MSGSEKKVNENTYDISSIKRVTKKFLEVSCCSRAKHRNVQKKCAARGKVFNRTLGQLQPRSTEHAAVKRPVNWVGVQLIWCLVSTFF